jgi:hypothetical protein
LVVRLDTSINVETLLVLDTDYTVTLNQNQDTNPGGSIVLPLALASDFTLTATSSIANLQPTDLTNQGGFYPTVINDSLDRSTIQIQQVAEQISRSFLAPVSDPASSVGDLPSSASRANKFLGFDVDGKPIALDALIGVPAEASSIRYYSAGDGAVPTDLQTLLRANIVDVVGYGVDTTGATDSSVQFQAAANACAGGKVLKIHGNIRLDQSITLPDTIGGIIGDGMRKTVITYTREQVAGQDGFASSSIKLRNGTGATFSNFSMVYTGTFYVAGQSYFGYVSGLYLVDCDDTLVDRVEGTGFNVAGVTFNAISRGSTDLCKRNIVTRCWLHHNRVAGCLLQWQQEFSAINNLLARNGDVRDGGTGYGIAAGSGTLNQDVLYAFNHTDHNYRKGLDVHDGDGYTIIGNHLNGDRIFPMSIENDSWPLNSLTIRDNIIDVDPTFYLASDDDAPPGTYSFLQCISVYVNPYGYAGAVPSIPNITISGNQIKNLGCDDATHALNGIYVNMNGSSAGVCTISDNHIRGNRLTSAINVQRGDNGGPLNVNIHDNNIRTGAAASTIIAINPNDTGALGTRGVADIHDNVIDVPSSAMGAIGVGAGLSVLRVNDNTLSITALTYPAIELGTTTNGKVWLNDNAIICTSGANVANIVYGQNAIYGKGNTYNNQPVIVPNRRSSLGGSNRKFASNLMSLTAGSATPIMRLQEQYTIGLYVIKWSAFRNDTGPNSVRFGAGVATFAAGFSDNGQGSQTSIAVLSSHSAGNVPGGATPVTVTFTLDNNDISLPYIGRLLVNAAVDCSFYCEVEQVSVMERTLTALNPVY